MCLYTFYFQFTDFFSGPRAKARKCDTDTGFSKSLQIICVVFFYRTILQYSSWISVVRLCGVVSVKSLFSLEKLIVLL